MFDVKLVMLGFIQRKKLFVDKKCALLKIAYTLDYVERYRFALYVDL